MKKLFLWMVVFVLMNGNGFAAPLQGVGIKQHNTRVSAFAPLPALNDPHSLQWSRLQF